MNISDDVLIFGKTMKEHNQALKETLERLRTAGLTLNKEKCTFNKTKLKFLGHIFSSEGIHPDPEKIMAIQNATSPKDQSEVRSFLGLVNFCAKFTPDLATITQPLRILIKKTTKWTWGKDQERAFEQIKERIASATNLAYFNKEKETEIWVDASPTGLGAVMIQKTQDGKSNSIAFASHSLNTTEMKYSQIEKEALAITWSIKHFHLYVYGHPFKIITDHQPLVSIFNKPNQQLSTRLERWRFKLQQYDFEVAYKPGKNNPADYMSRHPITQQTSRASESIAENYINFIVTNTIPKTMTINEVMKHSQEDRILKQVIKNIQTDSWNQTFINSKEEAQLKAFKKIKMELSTDKSGTFLLRGSRLVIPATLRDRVLEIAHSTHQGISRTKEILRQKVWFPGINKQVEKTVMNCRKCQASTEQYKQPELHPSKTPEGPWATLNIDHKGPLPTGEYLLVIMDQYSKFPIVEVVSSTLAKPNIYTLNKTFSTFGTPRIIYTDNGAPFNSREFQQFVSTLGIEHKKVTPKWPRANGSVERFNKTINKVLRIAHEFKLDWKNELHNLLRDYRTTPHATTQVTPAELLFNYYPNNKLPDARHIQKPMDPENMGKRMEKQKQQMKQYYNTHNQILKEDPKLGDWVLARQERNSKLHTPFDPEPYQIKYMKGSMITAKREGREITRNKSFFKLLPPKEKTMTSDKDKNNEHLITENPTKDQKLETKSTPDKQSQEIEQQRTKEADKKEKRIESEQVVEERSSDKGRTPGEEIDEINKRGNRKPTRNRKPPSRLICEN